MKKILAHDKTYYAFIIFFSCLLLGFFLRHIYSVNTVFELVDEYGYLANAEYLAKGKWGCKLAGYYGYGYSLLLIPLFFLCKTGIQLIHGAVLINSLIVVLMFWAEIAVTSKLCTRMDRYLRLLVSFILCFYPYIISSSMKIICECLLSLMVWVVWLLLFKILETKRSGFCILLGMTLAYLFYVHARTIPVIGTVLLIIGFLYIQKWIGVKQLTACVLSCMIVFGIGYWMKQELIKELYVGQALDSASGKGPANIINIDFIIERLRWLFSKDFKFYGYSLGCKVFYLFVSSLGLFPIGIYSIAKAAVSDLKKQHLSNLVIVKMSIGSSFIIMILAILASGAGKLDQYSYFYYGRYYEYLILPIFFLGIDNCLSEEIRAKTLVYVILIFLVSGAFCIALSKYLTNLSTSVVDTNRVVSFMYGAQCTTNYKEMIQYMLCLTVLGMVIMITILKKFKIKSAILIPVGLLFLINGRYTEKEIVRINQVGLGDNYIAEYLDENCDDEKIHFVNCDYKYDRFYTRMQILLGSRSMIVVDFEEVEEIPKGAYFATYNIPLDFLDRGCEPIMEGNAFRLYRRS